MVVKKLFIIRTLENSTLNCYIAILFVTISNSTQTFSFKTIVLQLTASYIFEPSNYNANLYLDL